MTESMRCPQCGAQQQRKNAQFCNKCGASLGTGSASPDRQDDSRRSWMPLLLGMVGILVVAAIVWLTPLGERLGLRSTEVAVALPTATNTPESLVTPTDMPVPTATPTPSLTPFPSPSSTLTPTSSPTAMPSPTPSPTGTQTPTITPLPTVVTPSPNSLRYSSLGLTPYANSNTQSGYINPPLGAVTLGSVPFSLGAGESIVTQANTLPTNPTQLTFTTDLPGSQAVFLLITGGNLYDPYDGRLLGFVRLRFDTGAVHDTDLIAGFNIREWKHFTDDVVTDLKSSDTLEVWRGGTSHDSGTAFIDMLRIEIPAYLRDQRLMAIEILDRTSETVGSLDPAINVMGITVASLAPTPTPTATPLACPYPVEAIFAAVWQQNRQWLGCSLQTAIQTGAATEQFEHGRMIWRQNRDWHYVLLDTGEWLDFPNEHIPGMSEPGIYQAPPGYFVPKLGFGLVWHQHLGGPDSALGWALEEEYWPGMQVQDFAQGHLFELEGVIYLLNASDRRWFYP